MKTLPVVIQFTRRKCYEMKAHNLESSMDQHAKLICASSVQSKAANKLELNVKIRSMFLQNLAATFEISLDVLTQHIIADSVCEYPILDV